MKKLTNFQRERIAIAAEIAAYGLGWCTDRENDETYNGGGVDTIGHALACCICQWVTKDSVGTSETLEFLKLEECHDKATIESRMLQYIKILSNQP